MDTPKNWRFIWFKNLSTVLNVSAWHFGRKKNWPSQLITIPNINKILNFIVSRDLSSQTRNINETKDLPEDTGKIRSSFSSENTFETLSFFKIIKRGSIPGIVHLDLKSRIRAIIHLRFWRSFSSFMEFLRTKHIVEEKKWPSLGRGRLRDREWSKNKEMSLAWLHNPLTGSINPIKLLPQGPL